MSGLDKDRLRNKTVSFRVSLEEARLLEARIKICGMPKAQFIIQSLLYGKISIVVGKYQSDRLSLELRRLREELDNYDTSNAAEQVCVLLENCKVLLNQLQRIIEQEKPDGELSKLDFVTVK